MWKSQQTLGWPTPLEAEHPEHIFQASTQIQARAAGLGDGRTGSRAESRVSKCWSSLPIMGHFGTDKRFLPRLLQNTFQPAAPSLHPYDLLSKINFQDSRFELDFFLEVWFFRLFFFLSWFTLHSQDVIKVQSEERRGTSSVSAISSTSC